MPHHKLFTCESVTEGHPDKLCDQVSDAVLDAALAQDPAARVACETTACGSLMLIMGEITAHAQLDYADIARKVIRDIGYTSVDAGFDANTCTILPNISKQSPDIALGVDAPDTGAGDQGMMFGYACSETPEHMPLALSLSHALTRRLAAVRKDGTLSYLRPDGKAQVTIAYGEDGKPSHAHAVVVSTQHAADVSQNKLRADVLEHVIRPVVGKWLGEKTNLYINPTGRFVIGGPTGDSGLTGRKIIVDTYGGYARHGGGAFSGKDPTKVDRSASYAMRQVARTVVAAGLADKCEVQVAYAIGVAKPVSLSVDTFSTGKIADRDLEGILMGLFDLRPRAIISNLGLARPLYLPTAAYGHFGRTDVELPWESLEHVTALLAKV